MTAAEAPAPAPAEQLLGALEQAANYVAMLTGVKAQFVAAGWTPANAEQAALDLQRLALAQQGIRQ